MVVIPGEEFVLESIVYGYLLALIEKFGLDEKKGLYTTFLVIWVAVPIRLRLFFIIDTTYNPYLYDAEAIR